MCRAYNQYVVVYQSHILTPSHPHPHTLTSSHPHPHIITRSHCHPHSSPHIHILTPSHHPPSPSHQHPHIHILTPSYHHTLTLSSSHPHLTPSHPHSLTHQYIDLQKLEREARICRMLKHHNIGEQYFTFNLHAYP